MKLPHRSSHGFTLMETLLAITLFAIVITSSFGVFQMGVQIWKRTTGELHYERKVYLTLERMQKDVQESLPVLKVDDLLILKERKDMTFEGDEKSFLFPAVLPVENERKEMTYQSGALGYAWDGQRKKICRQVLTESDFFLRKNPVCKPVLTDVVRADFEYLVANSVSGTYSWYKSWNGKDGIPRAIRVSFEIWPKSKPNEKRKIKPQSFLKTFWIPVSDKPKKEDAKLWAAAS